MKILNKENLLLTNNLNLIRFCISKGLEARHDVPLDPLVF